MQFTTIATAALAALPIASAGSAYVYNKCDFDVSLWSVSADGSSEVNEIKAGEHYSEAYKAPSVGGVSLKITNSTGSAGPVGKISQFEYTLAGTIWYDMSNVDCGGSECPFAQHGWYLDASDDSCPTRNCEADALTCTGAYVAFNDDHNTLMCQADKDISLYLCTSEKPSSDDQEEKRAAAPVQEYGVPAHRRRHARHPHVRSAMA